MVIWRLHNAIDERKYGYVIHRFLDYSVGFSFVIVLFFSLQKFCDKDQISLHRMLNITKALLLGELGVCEFQTKSDKGIAKGQDTLEVKKSSV